MINKWRSLSINTPKRVKEFYMFCVGLLINSEDFTDFKEILGNIITVSVNETTGEEIHSTHMTPAEIAKKKLIKRITSTNTSANEFLKENVLNTETGTADVEIVDEMNVNEWISEFWDNAMKNIVEGKDVNPFFNKDFSLQLK